MGSLDRHLLFSRRRAQGATRPDSGLHGLGPGGWMRPNGHLPTPPPGPLPWPAWERPPSCLPLAQTPLTAAERGCRQSGASFSAAGLRLLLALVRGCQRYCHWADARIGASGLEQNMPRGRLHWFSPAQLPGARLSRSVPASCHCSSTAVTHLSQSGHRRAKVWVKKRYLAHCPPPPPPNYLDHSLLIGTDELIQVSV